ncbi:hypothetical protein RB653_003498 [Dictyostelium firmibasis]|uniref:Uncharacterized protein n=1 Tax=Dictyostelium firmibasis TaxID=79012 RepID=A0AAN7U4Q3_9MYCE
MNEKSRQKSGFTLPEGIKDVNELIAKFTQLKEREIKTIERTKLAEENKFESTPMSYWYTKARDAFKSSRATFNSIKEQEKTRMEVGLLKLKNNNKNNNKNKNNRDNSNGNGSSKKNNKNKGDSQNPSSNDSKEKKIESNKDTTSTCGKRK